MFGVGVGGSCSVGDDRNAQGVGGHLDEDKANCRATHPKSPKLRLEPKTVTADPPGPAISVAQLFVPGHPYSPKASAFRQLFVLPVFAYPFRGHCLLSLGAPAISGSSIPEQARRWWARTDGGGSDARMRTTAAAAAATAEMSKLAGCSWKRVCMT